MRVMHELPTLSDGRWQLERHAHFSDKYGPIMTYTMILSLVEYDGDDDACVVALCHDRNQQLDAIAEELAKGGHTCLISRTRNHGRPLKRT